jgi:hypothetical protein
MWQYSAHEVFEKVKWKSPRPVISPFLSPLGPGGGLSGRALFLFSFSVFVLVIVFVFFPSSDSRLTPKNLQVRAYIEYIVMCVVCGVLSVVMCGMCSVCLCVYLSLWVCVCVCVCVCTWVSDHVCVCVCVCSCGYVCLYILFQNISRKFFKKLKITRYSLSENFRIISIILEKSSAVITYKKEKEKVRRKRK